jgi:5-amino-6-(5-phosphoribosylamino)uracil reductase
MHDRPRVLLNLATSLDGKINPAPVRRKGAFAMSRAPTDHARMLALRAEAEAVMIGASNLRKDDPDLALPPALRGRRRDQGDKEPFRIVVTTRGDGIMPQHRIFDPSLGGPTLVIHAASMPLPARALLAGSARLVEMGQHTVEMPRLLHWLKEELGVRVLLCEGGGQICSELFAARAVDSLYMTLVPRILGGESAPTMVGGSGFDPDQVPDPELASLERLGDELYLRYDFRWS